MVLPLHKMIREAHIQPSVLREAFKVVCMTVPPTSIHYTAVYRSLLYLYTEYEYTVMQELVEIMQPDELRAINENIARTSSSSFVICDAIPATRVNMYR